MKIALIGYGKMGKMIEQIALSRGHEIVSIIDIDNQQDFDSPEFASADVAIEFTAPHVAYGNYLKAFSHGVKVVSGSTGWMNDHKSDVERLCNEEGNTLFWASNFSIGVAIFSAVNRYLAKIMNGFPQYDVEMEEVHHIHKLDAPSGTAKVLASAVKSKLGIAPDITSSREGEVPGIHVVKFKSDVDKIKISHEAFSREGFAEGAVVAAQMAESIKGVNEFKELLLSK